MQRDSGHGSVLPVTRRLEAIEVANSQLVKHRRPGSWSMMALAVCWAAVGLVKKDPVAVGILGVACGIWSSVNVDAGGWTDRRRAGC